MEFKKLVKSWETPILENYYQAHDGPIYSISFNRTGKQLASGGVDGVFKIWNFKRTIRTYIFNDDSGPIDFVCFSPDGSTVLSVSRSIVQFRTPEMQSINWTFRPHTLLVPCADISHDGQFLATCSHDKTVKLWDIESQCNKYLCTFVEHRNWVNWVSFSPDSRQIVSSGDDGTVKIWDIKSRCCVSTYSHSRLNPVLCAKFLPNSNYIASCGKEEIQIWDIRKEQAAYAFAEHTGPILTMDFHRNGNYIGSGSVDGTVKIYNTIEKRIMYTLHGHETPVSAVQFTEDGAYLASADKKGRMFLWRTNIK